MVLPGCVPEQLRRASGKVGVGVAMARGHVLEEDEGWVGNNSQGLERGRGEGGGTIAGREITVHGCC